MLPWKALLPTQKLANFLHTWSRSLAQRNQRLHDARAAQLLVEVVRVPRHVADHVRGLSPDVLVGVLEQPEKKLTL